MPDWREKILEELTRSIKPIMLVSDPDNLIGDQKIQTRLREEGYLTYKYTDHILFRYTFETQYRTRLEKQNIKLIIITDTPKTNLNQKMPYDLIERSHVVTFSLSSIFPKLDYMSLKEVITNQIDRLYSAYQNYRGERIGQRQTKEFLLNTLYGIDPKSIITQNDYVSKLINNDLPDTLYEYLNEYLKTNQNAPEQLYTDEKELVSYLQNEWKNYVSNRSNTPSIISDLKIRSEIIQCFINNKLQSIPVSEIDKYPKWMQLGLIDNTKEIALQIIETNIEKIKMIIEPPQQPNHRDWKTVAYLWSEIIFYKNELDLNKTDEILEEIQKLEHNIDSIFIPWMLENHQSLYYMREKNPVTLSHITDHLYRNHGTSNTAIIVIDGMSVDQWIKIKRSLERRSPEIFQFEETMVYAALPTITSISRQTIASGTEPTLFKNESQAFNKEESLWVSNWHRRDMTPGYKKGLKLLDKKEINVISGLFDKQSLLIITDYLDKKIHEATNGKHEINREIEYWIENGILIDMIESLISHKYVVHITSDHGNVESTGIGTFNQGALSDKEGSRVRLYDEYSFALQAQQNYPKSILKPEVKDASHYFLYAPDRKSFRREDERQVSHGGPTIEEVKVPLVRIELNNAA